jgi:hypothetical protein
MNRLRMALGGALLLALACAPAPAIAASRAAVPNGTYNYVTSGSPSAPGQPAYVFTATVRDNVIASSRLWQQSWTAAVGVVWTLPGTPQVTTFSRTRISRRGSFQLGRVSGAGGEGSPASGVCLTGKAVHKALHMRSCNALTRSNGGLLFDAFPTKVKVPSGTWSGTSSGTQAVDPDGPHGPATGAVGTITLQVSGGAITGGTGSFAPVDPTTGVPTGGPAVSVTYGAGGFSRTSGFFSLPSTPAGYDLCGAVGAGNSGSILGLVACQQSTYLPSSFALGED